MKKTMAGIKAKTLLVTIVPLAFQLCFIIILGVLLGNSYQSIDRVQRCRSVIALSNETIGLFYESSKVLAVYYMMPSVGLGNKLSSMSDRIAQRLDSMEQLVRNNPNEHAAVVSATVSARHCIEDLNRARAQVETGDYGFSNRADRIRALKEVVMGNVQDLVSKLQALNETEKNIASNTPDSANLARTAIGAWLVAGVLINITLSVLISSTFSRTIIDNLKVLLANIERFGKAQPLLPRLAGRDELSTVDAAFHSMAERVRFLEQRQSELIAMVSHDLRSPLTSIRTLFQLLSSQQLGSLNDKGKKLVDSHDRLTENLIGLINNLLDLEKMQRGEIVIDRQPLPVSDLVVEALRASQSVADKKSIVIETNVCCQSVDVDKILMSQALANILFNAVKFSSDGKKILIKSGLSDAGGLLRITVSDEAGGIAPGDEDLIFARFQQSGKTSKEAGGSGLGLSIAQSIVELHGGKIGVDNRPGHGCDFWIDLPLSEQGT
jgi:signal transduction histidine kinase